MCIQFHKSD